MRNKNFKKNLQEIFGDPIGSYAGDAPVGVRDERQKCNECGLSTEDCLCSGSFVCPDCGMMTVDGSCGCQEKTCGCGETDGHCQCDKKNSYMNEACTGGCSFGSCTCKAEGVEPCDQCGMMEIEGEGCGCTHLEEKKKRGPSKKTAQKILKGTKTFADKMKKVSGWSDDPAAAAAWMMKKATGKWPSQK